MVSKIIFSADSFILLICESQTLIFITMGVGVGGGGGLRGGGDLSSLIHFVLV